MGPLVVVVCLRSERDYSTFGVSGYTNAHGKGKAQRRMPIASMVSARATLGAMYCYRPNTWDRNGSG